MLEVAPTETVAETSHASVEKLIKQFIIVRDAIEKIKARHEEELKEPRELQEKLTGRLTKFMDQYGVDSLKTASGTCYSSIKYSASIADADIFMKYVIDNQDWDLLDRKANVTAVRAFTEEKKQLPPGVNLSSREVLGVRSPVKKK